MWAALDSWLGTLGIDRCHMLGHSLGTLIAARLIPLSTSLKDCRAHHKPEDKQDQKGDDKDEEEQLGDPGSGGRDPSEAEHAGDDRNDQEK
jgi:hypothetical protein